MALPPDQNDRFEVPLVSAHNLTREKARSERAVKRVPVAERENTEPLTAISRVFHTRARDGTLETGS